MLLLDCIQHYQQLQPCLGSASAIAARLQQTYSPFVTSFLRKRNMQRHAYYAYSGRPSPTNLSLRSHPRFRDT